MQIALTICSQLGRLDTASSLLLVNYIHNSNSSYSNMRIYPPDEFKVDPFDISPEQVEEFLSLLTRNAGETEIDNFLQRNRSILAFTASFFFTGHHSSWILPQQAIRSQTSLKKKGLRPDYLFAGDNSDGITWFVLELKGANENIWHKDKNGDFRYSDAANRGLNQLTRYIDYCITNQQTIRDAYEISSFTDPKGILLIGREHEFMNDEEKRRLKARHNKLNPSIQIKTYDALIREISEAGEIQHQLPWLQKIRIKLFTAEQKEEPLEWKPVRRHPQTYRKGNVLVVESETTDNLDIIDDLREERIEEQTSW